jgi:hypothetical protein
VGRLAEGELQIAFSWANKKGTAFRPRLVFSPLGFQNLAAQDETKARPVSARQPDIAGQQKRRGSDPRLII